MRAFLAIAGKSFRRQLAYRAAFWTELIINLFFMVLYVYLWRAMTSSRATLTYIVVAQTVMTLQFTVRAQFEIEAKVRTGAIAVELMRPIDFQVAALATAAGPALHATCFNMVPKLLIFAAAGVLAAPASVDSGLLFVVSLVLAFLVQFGIETAIGLSAFWLIEIRGLHMFLFWGLSELFSGFFAPLDLYPDWLAAIARALPFQAIVYTPSAIWSGALAGAAALRAVALQAAWAAGLVLAGRAMLTVARRRLVTQGG